MNSKESHWEHYLHYDLTECHSNLISIMYVTIASFKNEFTIVCPKEIYTWKWQKRIISGKPLELIKAPFRASSEHH